MSKISLYLTLITTTLFAQNFWIKTTFPSGSQVNSVYSLLALTNERVLAGTFAMGLYISTDSGNNWTGLVQEQLWVKKLVKDNSSNIYAIFIGGTAGSGIFKSTNGGINWTKIFDPPHDGMTSIFVDDGNNIYLGLVYANGAGGIYKSSNGGLNWFNIFNQPQNVFTVTKTNTGRLLAGSYGKIFFSDDEGTQWSEYNFGINFSTTDFAIDNFGDVYLTTSGYGIYKSNSNGTNWSSVIGAGPEYTCIYIDNNNHIYAGTSGYWIYRSTNRGANWTLINSGMGEEKYVLSLSGIRGGYIYAGMDYHGIYRSANVVNVEENEIKQTNFMLYQNFPNPFNPNTFIKYTIEKESMVSIEIFNSIGQKIDMLVKKVTQPGSYEIEWNAQNLPAGIYIYKLTANELSLVKKMVLLR